MSLHRDTRFWFSPIRNTITYREPNEQGHSVYDLTPPRDWRPLVVIDPEDREQVSHLIRLWGDQYTSWSPDADGANADNMQAALREFANPTPSIEEPTGLGAVVEDDKGRIFIRYGASLAPWIGAASNEGHDPDRPYRYWSGINATRVLSEGVPAEADR